MLDAHSMIWLSENYSIALREKYCVQVYLLNRNLQVLSTLNSLAYFLMCLMWQGQATVQSNSCILLVLSCFLAWRSAWFVGQEAKETTLGYLPFSLHTANLCFFLFFQAKTAKLPKCAKMEDKQMKRKKERREGREDEKEMICES